MHQFHIKLFVIDYLQLLLSTARRAKNREQEIDDISGGIKALAKELDVPIIVPSQSWNAKRTENLECPIGQNQARSNKMPTCWSVIYLIHDLRAQPK